MELKGSLRDVSRDYRTSDLLITFQVTEIPLGVDKLPEGPLSISLKHWREKRSMSANAYYWVLVGKLAAQLGTSQAYIHNMLLRDYGQLEVVGGELVPVLLPDTDEAAELAEIDRSRHLVPSSKVVMWEGRPHRVYYSIKGSSLYDTKEMAVLIDGAQAEARHMGIETLSPEELERMMGEYEKHYAAG